MSRREIERVATALLEAEGGQVARDMGTHLGDEVHELLKRHGMLMQTTGGAVAMGALAAAQVLGETIAFARRSMSDSQVEPVVIEAAVLTLFVNTLSPILRAPERHDSLLRRLRRGLRG